MIYSIGSFLKFKLPKNMDIIDSHENSTVVIKNTLKISLKIYDTISEDILAEMNLDNYDEGYIRDQDFVLMELCMGVKKYNLLHGFPGDNPFGIVYTENGETVDFLGSGIDPTTPFRKWYIEITENCSKHPSEFFINFNLNK